MILIIFIIAGLGLFIGGLMLEAESRRITKDLGPWQPNSLGCLMVGVFSIIFGFLIMIISLLVLIN